MEGLNIQVKTVFLKTDYFRFALCGLADRLDSDGKAHNPLEAIKLAPPGTTSWVLSGRKHLLSIWP